MTNRVDFYQAEQQGLAIPAGAAVVFIEGLLCPYLEVMEIIQAGKPEYGSARLRYNPVADAEAGNPAMEDIERELGTGRPISVKWLYNNLYPAGGADGIVIFSGHIEKFDKSLESLEIRARDYSAVLERKTVFGRQIEDIGGRIVFLEGAGTIFNEGGQPNATKELVEHKGDRVRLFAADNSGTQAWDCADVVRYLLCEYVSAGQIVLSDEQRLRALMEGASVRDLDVTGMSLLEAIERCCKQAGVEFKFVPTMSETGPSQGIVFYKKGCGRNVELNIQPAGQRLSVSGTNIFKASSKGSFWPVTHKYTGEGDYKVFEATFNLVKTWRPNQESTDYDRYSPLTNPEFYKFKNVYRRFCLNEAGDFSIAPYNGGPAYDFSQIFGTDKYVHRRRRFWPALSCDVEGKSLGYFLEISYDDGVHWWQYMHAFDILLDECGIWLSSSRLDINTWVAGIKSVLWFRITASVVSDERLTCSAADGPVGSAVPVMEKVFSIPNKFKFKKVTGKSIFAGVNDGSIGAADEADDSAALNQYVRHLAQTDSEAIETFDVQTLYPGLGLEVGDIVKTGPDSRDIFSTMRDNRSTCVIERVRTDFLKQSTELKVVRRRNL